MERNNQLPTKGQVLANLNEIAHNGLSVAQIISSPLPTLAVIRAKTPEKLFDGLNFVISDLVEFFNVGKTMDGEQIKATSDLIAKEFYYLKFDDLKLIFNRMKTGFYGKAYDRIDGQTICLAIREYCEERSNTAETLYLEKAKEFKQAETEIKYLVQVGEDYIRESDTRYLFEPKKELATTYSYNDAYALKTRLLQNNYEDVKMVNEKQISGLMERLIVDKPDLVDNKTKYHYATRDYYEKKQAIEASDMTEFEKCNAIRALAELEPFTNEEYTAYILAITNPHSDNPF